MEELEKRRRKRQISLLEQEEQWAKAERKVIVTVKEDLEQKAFNEINKDKKSSGANPLKWSASAAQQAQNNEGLCRNIQTKRRNNDVLFI